MHRIFVGTAVWTLLFFAAEFVLGLLSGPERLTVFHVHMLGGVFLATFVCVIHIMVMFHFIGSGKELKEAAEILGENADIYILVRRFKAQTFPYARFAHRCLDLVRDKMKPLSGGLNCQLSDHDPGGVRS